MKLWLCLSLLAASYIVVRGAWQDCGTPGDAVISFNSFAFTPSEVVYPGDLTATLNVTVSKDIASFFVDAELNRTTFTGASVNIPCSPGTLIGSCKDINGCNMLNTIVSGPTGAPSTDLGQQIMGLLVKAIGQDHACPVTAGTAHTSETTHLAEVTGVTAAVLTDGNYHLKVMIKESATSTTNLGCLEFDAKLKNGARGGLLFG